MRDSANNLLGPARLSGFNFIRFINQFETKNDDTPLIFRSICCCCHGHWLRLYSALYAQAATTTPAVVFYSDMSLLWLCQNTTPLPFK